MRTLEMELRRWRVRALVAAPTLLVVAVFAACNSGGGKAPVVNVGNPCDLLAQAERYRYTFTLSLESPQPEGDVDETAVGDPPFALGPDSPDLAFSQEFEGAFENPDKFDITVKTGGTDLDLRLIFIGDQQWRSIDGAWTPIEGQPIPFPPADMCDDIVSGFDLTGVSSTPDSIDGSEALRYRAEDAELDTAARIFPGSDQARLIGAVNLTVWLAEGGDVPLRMESIGVGTYPSGREITLELTLEVADVNADDIKIEPPI